MPQENEDDKRPDDDIDEDKDERETDDSDADDADGDDRRKKREREADEDDSVDDKMDARARSAFAKLKKANRTYRDDLANVQARLREFEDKDKSETQRLQEAAEEAKSKAGTAELNFQRLQVALDRAPEGASIKRIRAVAKRLAGDTAEEMEEDADELFALLAPAKNDDKKAPPGKPREKLRGGGEPDEEPEEMNPSKLADAIGRRR